MCKRGVEEQFNVLFVNVYRKPHKQVFVGKANKITKLLQLRAINYVCISVDPYFYFLQ